MAPQAAAARHQRISRNLPPGRQGTPTAALAICDDASSVSGALLTGVKLSIDTLIQSVLAYPKQHMTSITERLYWALKQARR